MEPQAAPWPVIPPGQEAALRPAFGATRRGRLAQAWLLTGPTGVGKRTAARALVAAQFCAAQAPSGAPCGACPSCAAVGSGSHADVHWTGPEGRLGVDEARAIGRVAALRPDGALSAFVVEACERLTGFAAAALLKTMEDPPGPALFVLLAEHPAQLEPTLRSRCQLLRLAPVPVPLLATWLRTRFGHLSAQEAAAAASTAEGIVGRALSLVATGDAPPPAPPRAAAATAIPAALSARTQAEVLALAAGLGEARAPVEDVLAVLRDLFLTRREALAAGGGPAGTMDPDALAQLAPAWGEPQIAAAAAVCGEALDVSAFPVNAVLNWERLLLRLQHLRTSC